MEEVHNHSSHEPDEDRATAWLSRGLEALVGNPEDDDRNSGANKSPAGNRELHFDYVIVGSGYGGAVAASELAAAPGAGRSICILERGGEYLRGMFPQRMADVAGFVRFATPEAEEARGQLDGLFDFRVGPDVNALVASGLGGGSLINAGVMEMPHPSVFREARWPQAVRDDQASGLLSSLGSEMKVKLGTHRVGTTTKKFAALAALAPKKSEFRAADITVAAVSGANTANTQLDACIKCGDCATGCNHNAKDSLDVNLLRVAAVAGAKIYTGASVLRLERAAHTGDWIVLVNHTERHLRRRQKLPFRVHARCVILAAGTLGSTEILIRSQTHGLQFSPQLGKKFSTNGDMIAVLNDTALQVNGVADESAAAEKRDVGPTISAMIDLRTGDPETDLVIQDLAVPGALRRLFEETVATADALNKLLVPDPCRHAPDMPFCDAAAVDPHVTGKSLAVAMIGRDSADGLLERREPDVGDAADGLLTIRWPALRDDPRFAAHHERLTGWLEHGKLRDKSARVIPRVIQNPVWRPLTAELERIFGAQRGPLLTVHPLGGCPMGEGVEDGVVDHCGRVFDPYPRPGQSSFHDGLFVLDGSIVPTSLGINPSLTISVLALRAMRHLIGETPKLALPTPLTRPVFARPQPAVPARTEIEITEQVCGRIFLKGDSLWHPGHGVELTLTYDPKALEDLIEPCGAKRYMQVGNGKGRLRIVALTRGLKAGEWILSDTTELEAEVSGTLRIFRHGGSLPYFRRARALAVWVAHRGLRDVAQNIFERLRIWRRMEPLPDQDWQGVFAYLAKIWKLSDHTGSVRLLEYDLTTHSAVSLMLPTAGFEGSAISARKRLRYAYGANPWQQLQEMTVHAFPLAERWWSIVSPRGLWLALCSIRNARSRYLRRARLVLNLDYLVAKVVPLLRVVGQQDRPTALVDLTRFALYLARVVLQVHALTFRKPEPSTDRAPARLPTGIAGRLPDPDIEWRVVGTRKSDHKPAFTRLARYRDPTQIAQLGMQGRRPVLLIHGYSASGTTFAHAAVDGNLAETLCRAGRDVWIIDMRSSAALATATEDWAFEDMSLDINDAIDHILRVAAGSENKVDVVAHCMGSAMFSMALLADTKDRSNYLNGKVGRLVLSQVGPVLELSTSNLFRAYVMRWVRHFLPLADYSFRPKKPSLGGGMLDRILATLRYPRAEFPLENPLWPPGAANPWATTRHRMDALYSRTFNLANLPAAVLDHIDDFFGPLSIETVSQVIHFARSKTITDRTGFNAYVNPFRLQSRFIFPTLYIHGEDNGLVDPRTLTLMSQYMVGAGIDHLNDGPDLMFDRDLHALIDRRTRDKRLRNGAASLTTWCIPGHGHQDPLIGREAGRTSRVIEHFLAA